MIKIWIPKNDLHLELFRHRNIFQARLVVLNVLVRGKPKLRVQVLKRVKPKQMTKGFERFLFEAMVEMIHQEGQVDIEQVRCNIPLWIGEPGPPTFVAQCLANYALMLSYRPTEAQVERAIKIITSPPPPRRMYKTEPHAHPKAKASKRTQKGK